MALRSARLEAELLPLYRDGQEAREIRRLLAERDGIEDTMKPAKDLTPLTVQEAGRLGGEAVREKYGVDYYQRIGKMGGDKTKELHGDDYYSVIGKQGRAARRKRSA